MMTSRIRKRDEAIQRGLDFIYRFGSKAANFEDYGTLMICCFALAGATSRNQKLRKHSRKIAKQLGRRWKNARRIRRVSANSFLNSIQVQYALGRIGERDAGLEHEIKDLSEKFSARDLLGFDPLHEPPPDDLPYACDCGLENQRGRKFCKRCRRKLLIKTRYRAWMDALANTYVAERCGTIYGAQYTSVLSWLPKMRPYPIANTDDDEIDEVLSDAIYAVTHVVYTLNDYGTYKLSPGWLPQEFAFLKANVEVMCAEQDAEVSGELLDSLRAFGLRATHALIARGTDYLLANQNDDGSWGDKD